MKNVTNLHITHDEQHKQNIFESCTFHLTQERLLLDNVPTVKILTHLKLPVWKFQIGML